MTENSETWPIDRAVLALVPLLVKARDMKLYTRNNRSVSDNIDETFQLIFDLADSVEYECIRKSKWADGEEAGALADALEKAMAEMRAIEKGE